MKSKKGRPKSSFTPEEFQELSKEERQLRGRISTLRRMIKKRESQIEELRPSIMKEVNRLMKPIKKKESEIKGFKDEIDQIRGDIKQMDIKFPPFVVETYYVNGHDYYRGRWYINEKKRQLYLGTKSKVLKRVNEKYPNIKDPDKHMDKVLEVFQGDLLMRYWKDEYENKD